MFSATDNKHLAFATTSFDTFLVIDNKVYDDTDRPLDHKLRRASNIKKHAQTEECF